VTAYGSVDFCQKYGFGVSYSRGERDTTSTGEDARVNASFAVGLRLPNPPFPGLPVGSLLLVGLPHGDTLLEHALSAQVVHGHSVIVLDQPTDLYLIVNDLAGCGVGASALTVS